MVRARRRQTCPGSLVFALAGDCRNCGCVLRYAVFSWLWGVMARRAVMVSESKFSGLRSGLAAAVLMSQIERPPAPTPERGWELLNQHAAALPDGLRGEFIAVARDFEGAFTSGYLYEEGYVASLNRIGKILLAEGCPTPGQR